MKQKKHICIIGLGEFGAELARELSRQCEVLVLDLRKRFGVFVIAIRELVPPRFVFLPVPDFVIKPSDVLVVIGRERT